MDESVIADYADAYKRKVVFPPLVVFSANGKPPYMIADGMHRASAATKAGVKLVLCEIYTGGPSDCLRFALGANATHGLRRTSADKRRAIQLALNQWPKLSSREVARLCSVSDWLVAEVRDDKKQVQELAPEDKEDDEAKQKRLGKDGKWQKSAKRKVGERGVPAPSADKDGGWLDKTGFAIPDPARPCWERRDVAVGVCGLVDELIDRLKQAEAEKDSLFSEVVFNSVFSDLEKVRTCLETAIPFAVCPTCQGQITSKCTLCSGRGMISKFRYDRLVPAEIKKMREKGKQ